MTNTRLRLTVRAAQREDLPRLTEIYNHYVINTPITFDLTPFTLAERSVWFAQHAERGRHRLLVAVEDGRVQGYASTSQFRAKAAYDTTVESSVYCAAGATERGLGTLLYQALFAAIENEDVHRIAAGITLPNPASIALHQRFGFKRVALFGEVGRKFDRYWDVAWFERALRL